MKRQPFTSIGGGLPDCFTLVPETDDEQQELENALDDQGVCNSMGFSKSGINGRLNIDANPQWENGAMKATVTVQGEAHPKDAWFWVVECEDGSGRRFAWWSMKPDIKTASTWS